MTAPARSEVKVTTRQLVMLASNVNDRRVITEAEDIARQCEVDPKQVYSYTYRPGRTPKMVFELFQVDAVGGRVAIHDDGTPYDPDAGKPFHYVTKVHPVTWRGALPTWWDQAAKQKRD